MTAQSLTNLLYHQVQDSPDSTALVQGNVRVSYGELWRRTEQLAAALREQGITAGDRVILFMKNGTDYVAAYYAILRLAAVVVPLSTDLQGVQLAHLAFHAQAKLLLYDGVPPDLNACMGVPGNPPACRRIEDLVSLQSAPKLTRTLSGDRVSPGQLSAIMYTSGTTGRPKGVMLSAENLAANTLAIVQYLELGRDDRLMCVLPFYYAYGNSVLHTHLISGATLILENSLMYPRRILEGMEAEEATGFAGVPSTFRLLLLRCDLSRFPLPALRYITQAGGALSPRDIQRVTNYWPQARFFVMYGQTEATARLTYLPPERLADKAGTVGIPVPGVRIKITGDDGKEKPRGESGEICAAGPNTMLGYWCDPAATASRFRGRWLRTGDLGVQDREGFVTVTGRANDMIKIGEHRVAPEEIEQVIAAMDAVEQVAVVGRPDRILGQTIKAFVVLAAGSSMGKRDILQHCRQQCAPYKIPREIEFPSDLPRTASGKIQRYKLLDVHQRAQSST